MYPSRPVGGTHIKGQGGLPGGGLLFFMLRQMPSLRRSQQSQPNFLTDVFHTSSNYCIRTLSITLQHQLLSNGRGSQTQNRPPPSKAKQDSRSIDRTKRHELFSGGGCSLQCGDAQKPTVDCTLLACALTSRKLYWSV